MIIVANAVISFLAVIHSNVIQLSAATVTLGAYINIAFLIAMSVAMHWYYTTNPGFFAPIIDIDDTAARYVPAFVVALALIFWVQARRLLPASFHAQSIGNRIAAELAMAMAAIVGTTILFAPVLSNSVTRRIEATYRMQSGELGKGMTVLFIVVLVVTFILDEEETKALRERMTTARALRDDVITNMALWYDVDSLELRNRGAKAIEEKMSPAPAGRPVTKVKAAPYKPLVASAVPLAQATPQDNLPVADVVATTQSATSAALRVTMPAEDDGAAPSQVALTITPTPPPTPGPVDHSARIAELENMIRLLTVKLAEKIPPPQAPEPRAHAEGPIERKAPAKAEPESKLHAEPPPRSPEEVTLAAAINTTTPAGNTVFESKVVDLTEPFTMDCLNPAITNPTTFGVVLRYDRLTGISRLQGTAYWNDHFQMLPVPARFGITRYYPVCLATGTVTHATSVHCAMHVPLHVHKGVSTSPCAQCATHNIGRTEYCDACFVVVPRDDKTHYRVYTSFAPGGLLGFMANRLTKITAGASSATRKQKIAAMVAVAGAAAVTTGAIIATRGSKPGPYQMQIGKKEAAGLRKAREQKGAKAIHWYEMETYMVEDGSDVQVYNPENDRWDAWDKRHWQEMIKKGSAGVLSDEGSDALDAYLDAMDDGDRGLFGKVRRLQASEIPPPYVETPPEKEFSLSYVHIALDAEEFTLQAHTGSTPIKVSLLESVILITTNDNRMAMGCFVAGRIVTAEHIFSKGATSFKWNTHNKVKVGEVTSDFVTSRRKFGDITVIQTDPSQPRAKEIRVGLPAEGSDIVVLESLVTNGSKFEALVPSTITAVKRASPTAPYIGGFVVLTYSKPTREGTSGCPVMAVNSSGALSVVGVHHGINADNCGVAQGFDAPIIEYLAGLVVNARPNRLQSAEVPVPLAAEVEPAPAEAKAQTALSKALTVSCSHAGCSWTGKAALSAHGTRPCHHGKTCRTYKRTHGACHFLHPVSPCEVADCTASDYARFCRPAHCKKDGCKGSCDDAHHNRSRGNSTGSSPAGSSHHGKK